MDELKTILCPVDFSPASHLAARKAAILSRAIGARLVVLHVVEPSFPGSLGLSGMDPSPMLAQHERSMREKLDALASELEAQHGVSAQVWLVAGQPHELIVRAANERNANLIVMGRGKHRGLMRMLGSVADRVSRKAGCPIIVCPKVHDEEGRAPETGALAS